MVALGFSPALFSHKCDELRRRATKSLYKSKQRRDCRLVFSFFEQTDVFALKPRFTRQGSCDRPRAFLKRRRTLPNATGTSSIGLPTHWENFGLGSHCSHPNLRGYTGRFPGTWRDRRRWSAGPPPRSLFLHFVLGHGVLLHAVLSERRASGKHHALLGIGCAVYLALVFHGHADPAVLGACVGPRLLRWKSRGPRRGGGSQVPGNVFRIGEGRRSGGPVALVR